MGHEVLISVRDATARIAQIKDGRLVGFQAAPMGQKQADAADRLNGRIYLAQVERVVPHLQAAFVNIGLDRAGFLGAREARALVPGADRETPIEDCVQSGDTLLVQVTRPPVGDKGAQITADVTLPGRAVVIAPCRNRIAVSRSIEDEAERTRLGELAGQIIAGENADPIEVEGMDGPAGWVIRTAAVGMQADELAADMASVAAQWDALIDQAEEAKPPSLLHEDLGPVERAVRDLVRSSTEIICIEDEAAFRAAQAYCRQHSPDLVDRIEKSDDDEYLFDRHNIDEYIEEAQSARVELPSGGWVMFETTQAMTTIDVNSGNHDAPARAVNLEAAQIIARQIRLRGLGGLIAIDFIDMTESTDSETVLQALDEGFTGDKQPVRIGPMSEFSVVEMTRRRSGMTLAQSLQQIRPAVDE